MGGVWQDMLYRTSINAAADRKDEVSNSYRRENLVVALVVKRFCLTEVWSQLGPAMHTGHAARSPENVLLSSRTFTSANAKLSAA